MIVGPERCDDGNARSGDGCQGDCLAIEPGYVCNNRTGRLCCKEYTGTLPLGTVDGQQIQMECHDTWWVAYNGSIILGSIPLNIVRDDVSEDDDDDDDDYDVFTLDEDIRLCGNLRIMNGHLAITSALTVAGTVTVDNGAALEMHHGGTLNITSACYGILYFSASQHGDQLNINSEATLEYHGLDWNDAEVIPEPVIYLQHCLNLNGSLYITAENLPTDSNTFPFIWSDDECHRGVPEAEEKLASDLPGGCSDVRAGSNGENVELTFNYKHLCAAQIAGIVVGSVIAAAAATAGVAAFAFGLGAPSDTGDYVAL